jgi:predicted TIM-barrel fold metal-dependent hydrolase
MAAYHSDASDYEGTNLIRDWAERFDLDITSLDDLETLIDAVLTANVRAGARSLKVPIAYERTLAVGQAPREQAAKIFGRSPDAVSRDERVVFGDYVLRFFLDRARDQRLVVQVHVGLARLEDSHPLQLLPLLREFPDVVFDLFHGGYPWIREMAALAHSYPNVRLNLVWLPLLSTDAAVAALREWVQVVPQVDRICWGSDARTPEETFGSLLATKYAISLALGQLVDEGYFSLSSAIKTGESILAGGARSIYGLPDSASQ